uniref:Uncharacterized protein n=1 Tax=Rousettus aegyptiacus TaxID=9407 RepID=A0A7J8HSN0_ROUAE|nr:hypothetical protein HJG63_011089 [Rousettus aegyptiacus]
MKISISQSFQRILISGLLLPLRLADSPTKGIWNLFFSSSWKMESENTTWPSLPNSRLEEPTPLSSPFRATRWRRLLAGSPVKQLVFTREKHLDHGLVCLERRALGKGWGAQGQGLTMEVRQAASQGEHTCSTGRRQPYDHRSCELKQKKSVK